LVEEGSYPRNIEFVADTSSEQDIQTFTESINFLNEYAELAVDDVLVDL
jgi:hypothetical protein